MKKILSVLFLIVCSLVCVACGNPTISYTKDKITINMGYNYVISSSDIEAKNARGGYEIVSLDEDIAEVNGYIITPKQKGETTIRIRLLDDNSIKFDIKLTVTEITYAENISIDDTLVYINMNSTTEAYNPITFNAGCNEIPEVTYDNEIIDYDYISGKITAKKLGETVVVVMFRQCNVSFRVRVIDKIFTTVLNVKDCVVVEGYDGKFNFSVFPDNANTYSFFTTSSLLSVTPTGYYSALEAGEATVYCEYTSAVDAVPILINFKVTIIDRVEEFDFQILDYTNSQQVNYFIYDRKYKLKINFTGDISNKNVVVSNINMVSSLEAVDGGYIVDFYFKNLGENIIKVDLCFDGENVALTQEKNVHVSSLTDIKIIAKWSAYIQNVTSDGKYYIYLDYDGLKPNYLEFYPSINDEIIGEELTVYNTTSGFPIEDDNSFIPTQAGEYSFSFEIGGMSVGECIVVVV